MTARRRWVSRAGCALVAASLGALPGRADALPDDGEHLQIRSDGQPCPLRGSMCIRQETLSKSEADAAWTLDVDVNLRRNAWAGNALFILYDAEDPEAIGAREVTALYQAPIAAGRAVSARLVLAPDDGFRPGHTYLLRVAQLVDGKEILLADGQIALR